MNLTRSAIKVFTAKGASSLIGFLGIAFFARELASDQMGSLFLFQALLGIIAIPANFGINNAVTKRFSEGESPESILSTAILLKGLLLLPFVAGIVLFQGAINNYLGDDLALLLIPALILQESAKLTIQVLKGELRVGETAAPSFFRSLVYICVGAILVWSGRGVRGIIYGLFAGFVVMLVWGMWKSSTTVGLPSLGHARSLFNYSKYAFISSVGGYFYSWVDIAIIGLFLAQSDVGVYEIAWRVTAVVMLFSSSIATTIFPQVSQWDAEGVTKRIESLLPEAIAVALFIAIPAFFGVVLFSRDILGLTFGTEYTAASLVLIILTGEKVIQSIHVILGRSLQAIDRPDLAAKAGVISISLNLVLNVVLVLSYGIVGAAVATAFSFIINSILHAYYLSKFVSIRIPYIRIGGCVAASFGMAIVLYIVESAIQISSLPMLLLTIGFGITVYVGFALIIPPSRGVILDNMRRAVD
ncbi:Membrane protein involved in the export of O-antigen and teichoic acid [Halopenitus malekzadehii]|uniref:Membrane protein involved in the export of O-antigen and teichoic acid n=1 Tax=Halopenitus malekzadehii TaxID=1267564 RepID=A0A1H6IED6_9EURY|nr:polysaccharide biosynthesis C-terminal domain-containing protein [Halopenitus malekzadehii]SEH45500.1 Membrane protein involved in the export of O-antigen and teichoic acid [Halopenitus malekzadehii]